MFRPSNRSALRTAQDPPKTSVNSSRSRRRSRGGVTKTASVAPAKAATAPIANAISNPTTDGTPITQTNISAFQHAWFDILAADLGYLGTSKWDSYYGKYDNGTQAYYTIGAPQNGWPLYPMYNLLQLFTTTVKRGWSVVAVDSVPATSRILAAYVGQKKQLTVIGLDTVGAQLNTGTATTSSYTVAGFPPSKPVNLLVWNANADGLVAPRQKVTADSNGVVNVTIAQHSVFVLTTVRLG